MAADASIFQQFLQPVRSVQDYANDMDKRDLNALQLVAMRRQNDLADLTAQQTRDQLAQNAAKRNALQAIYSSPDAADPIKRESLMLANPLLAADGQSMQKARLDAAHVQAQAANQNALAGKNAAEQAAAEYKARIDKANQALKDIASFQHPGEALADLQAKMQAGHIQPEQAQVIAQQLQSIQNPAQWQQWQQQTRYRILDAKDQLEQDWKAKAEGRATTNDAAQNANRELIPDPNNPGRFIVNQPLVDAKKSIAAASVPPQMPFTIHVDPKTGQAVAIPTKGNPGQALNAVPINLNGAPLAAPDTNKPSVDYLKQAEAYRNMDDALTDYKAKLSGFKNSDMLSPSRRAEIGTAYNNAMLQAKEIYKLGVLNGGDERILNSIINSPLSLTGATLPVDALVKQASDLQGIIKRGNENLAKINKQQVIPLRSQEAAASAPAGGVPDDIAAILNKHGGGK